MFFCGNEFIWFSTELFLGLWLEGVLCFKSGFFVFFYCYLTKKILIVQSMQIVIQNKIFKAYFQTTIILFLVIPFHPLFQLTSCERSLIGSCGNKTYTTGNKSAEACHPLKCIHHPGSKVITSGINIWDQLQGSNNQAYLILDFFSDTSNKDTTLYWSISYQILYYINMFLPFIFTNSKCLLKYHNNK